MAILCQHKIQKVMLAGRWVLIPLTVTLLLHACSQRKNIYTSECSEGIIYKRVNFSHLVDSIKYYDKQYVEVTGKYVEGKNLSALLNDSNVIDRGNSHALWVNFSQDCPLILTGTHTGLFEYGDGNFSKINNHIMTVRGKVDRHQKGHLKSYRGAIDIVSYVELR
ncbi:hypothetical protein [Mucilaginibacter sp.]|jgi:hypothetical protein|uniref:hypothetical protein n=1 Tax=Mucilaginibacter sp. TaxID=1882438 RepID=UPI003567DF9D